MLSAHDRTDEQTYRLAPFQTPTSTMSTHAQSAHNDKTSPTGTDPRLDRPRPLAWKRAALVALLSVLFWLAFYLRPNTKSDPEPTVIYASRSVQPSFPPIDDTMLMLSFQVLERVQVSTRRESRDHRTTQGRESSIARRTPDLVKTRLPWHLVVSVSTSSSMHAISCVIRDSIGRLPSLPFSLVFYTAYLRYHCISFSLVRVDEH